jgi:hypothetical protein
MDGPQLRGRWSSRHAAVLADDPGSAVLTVTSLGMVRRSKTPPCVQARDCVALWTERGKAPRELDLATGAHALLLSLSAQQRRQKTLDIRRQRDSGGLVEYHLGGCQSVTLPDPVTYGWLFNPASADHIAEARERRAMSGWSSPFEKWVVEGWAEHSKRIGGPEIAEAFRRNLADAPGVKARVFAATKATASASVKTSAVAKAAAPAKAVAKTSAKPAATKPAVKLAKRRISQRRERSSTAA